MDTIIAIKTGALVEVEAIEYKGVLYRIVVVPQDKNGTNAERFAWAKYDVLAIVRRGSYGSGATLIGHPGTDEIRLQWEEFLTPSSAPVRAFDAGRRMRWAKLERMPCTPMTELEVRMLAEQLGYPVEVDRDDMDEPHLREWVLIRERFNLNVYFRGRCPWRVFGVRRKAP